MAYYPKFNIGDMVYLISDNNIQYGRIEGIVITPVNSELSNIKSQLIIVKYCINYNSKREWINESKLY